MNAFVLLSVLVTSTFAIFAQQGLDSKTQKIINSHCSGLSLSPVQAEEQYLNYLKEILEKKDTKAPHYKRNTKTLEELVARQIARSDYQITHDWLQHIQPNGATDEKRVQTALFKLLEGRAKGLHKSAQDCDRYKIKWHYLNIIENEHENLNGQVQSFAKKFEPVLARGTSVSRTTKTQLSEIAEYNRLEGRIQTRLSKTNCDDEQAEIDERKQIHLDIDRGAIDIAEGTRMLAYIVIREDSRCKDKVKVAKKHLEKSDDSEVKGFPDSSFLRIRAAIRRKHPNLDAKYQDRLAKDRLDALSEALTEQRTSSNFNDVPAVAGDVSSSGPAHECRCRYFAHSGYFE